MNQVSIIRTGTANLASVRAAMRRLAWDVQFIETAQAVRDAQAVVLPGVGAFAAARNGLQTELVSAIQERVEQARPTLAICLGMQLLASGSEESPGVAGLGLIPGTAQRFPSQVRVPQLGWNQVRAEPTCQFLTDGEAYYANSYRLPAQATGWQMATSDHAGEFLAAAERGDVLACQFHPELSGAWGMQVLERWSERARNSRGPSC